MATSSVSVSACAYRPFQSVIQKHRIMVIPTERLRPAATESVTGETRKLDYPENEAGETFMIVIRGRL